jgi:hypothetical protein
MRRPLRGYLLLLPFLLLCSAAGTPGQGAGSAAEAYRALKEFKLDGGSLTVSNLALRRDRAQVTFNGTFYFPQPVLGKITGAVFTGRGAFRAEPPPSLFERENLQRMLKADVVESSFETAVLRFTDDTAALIGPPVEPRGSAPPEAQKLATEFGARMARETGANPASRILLSLLNGEEPGVFLAEFDKGNRGRFSFVLDLQCRIPTVNFGINGGEKGLVYAYNSTQADNDVWMAFYSLEDYEVGRVSYADAFDLVRTPKYTLAVDLREPGRMIKVNAQAQIAAIGNRVRAIPFSLTEDLPEWDQLRKKKGMRVTAARLAGSSAVEAFQEEWEGGFLVVLPAPLKASESQTLEMEVEGDFVYDLSDTFDCHYPFINGEWYPRHGYLARSKFDITFRHAKKYKVAGPGTRTREEPAPDNANEVLTTYVMENPVALVTFALGPFVVHKETRKLVAGELPTEFFSVASTPIKEDFLLAEMGNSVDYMGALFGKYPYPVFRAAFHPFGFGQGFATMLAIPDADSARKGTFVFISHETAHQWWGNIVAWRSYRDQWLSEGFAEYSGLMYMRERTKNTGDLREMLSIMRDTLKAPPRTDTGIGSKRVTDIGPIILGQRLFSSRSMNAYGVLTYNKGALVLRMLHFLFTNPATGDGEAFFVMMRDFVQRHKDGSATTEAFAQVAAEHFVRTPVAQKYGMKDLNWFFRQWVWQTHLPAYRLEYTLENQPDGKVLVKGTLFQEGAPENWVMPLPLVFKFGGNQSARGTLLANGPQQPFSIPLPMRPEAVELDPDMWVLSEKTTTRKR